MTNIELADMPAGKDDDITRRRGNHESDEESEDRRALLAERQRLGSFSKEPKSGALSSSSALKIFLGVSAILIGLLVFLGGGAKEEQEGTHSHFLQP